MFTTNEDLLSNVHSSKTDDLADINNKISDLKLGSYRTAFQKFSVILYINSFHTPYPFNKTFYKEKSIMNNSKALLIYNITKLSVV